MIFFIVQSISSGLKGLKENIICTIDDVLGDVLWRPHGITPAAVK